MFDVYIKNIEYALHDDFGYNIFMGLEELKDVISEIHPHLDDTFSECYKPVLCRGSFFIRNCFTNKIYYRICNFMAGKAFEINENHLLKCIYSEIVSTELNDPIYINEDLSNYRKIDLTKQINGLT